MGDLTRNVSRVEGDVLDHAAEFVTLVTEKAPGRYARWLALPELEQLLQDENAFNAGKLQVWAEFTVFREEFRARFPEATDAACINAFCKLFLKNDISLSNLVTFMETWLGKNGRLLAEPD